MSMLARSMARDALPGRHSVTPRTAIALTAAATACAVFVAGALVEHSLVSVMQPSAGELTWIGDVVLAASLGVVLYLWLDLRFTRAALAELERTKIVLDTQLGVAAKIQRDLLPPAPRARWGISWAVQLISAGQIGGDFYDFVDSDDRSRIAMVGDIAGKGIPAAMMLVYIRALFRQAVRQTHEPSVIVSRIADGVYAETGGESYLTCIVLRVDDERRCVTSTTAGHPPAFLVGAASKQLTRGGPPAGMFPNTRYDQETTELVAGSRIIVLTDGITERMSTTFERDVASLDRHLSAQELCTSIFQFSESRDASSPVPGWDDDRTALVIAVD